MNIKKNLSRLTKIINLTGCIGFPLGCFLFCFSAFGNGGISGTYVYQAFDANGNLLVRGVVTLRLDQTVQVTGSWKLQTLDKNKSREHGPQAGAGRIVGQSNGEKVFLNLNPDQYDNNIFLDGRKTTMVKISGKWGYYGYAGKLNEGNFEMVRQQEAPK